MASGHLGGIDRIGGIFRTRLRQQARERVLPLLTTEHTPASEPVALGELWRQAQAYAETHRGSEIFAGSGGSMLPLYQDRTVLIVRAMKLE